MQRHQNIDLKALDFLISKETVYSVAGCLRERQNGNRLESDWQRVEAVFKGIMQKQMLCPIFTEVNSRIIGLISIEYGVDFASEA
jgi:hypothetical protein